MIFLLVPIALCLGAGRFYFNPLTALLVSLPTAVLLAPSLSRSNGLQHHRPKHPTASWQNTDIPKTPEVTLKHLLPKLQHLLSTWWPRPGHSPALGGSLALQVMEGCGWVLGRDCSCLENKPQRE